jgi:hypothetical protein
MIRTKIQCVLAMVRLSFTGGKRYAQRNGVSNHDPIAQAGAKRRGVT